MKTGQIFWGTFLVSLGLLIFLHRIDVIPVYWDFPWKLWPVFFIFWGLMVISKNSNVRPLITALFGIFVALMVEGAFYGITEEISYQDDGNYTRVYTEDLDSTTLFARLEVDGGAGYFTIDSKTDKLVESQGSSINGDYKFSSTQIDSTAEIKFSFGDNNIHLFGANFKNRLNLKLNDRPEWDLNFNIGAAKAIFDLTKFKIKNLTLNTGATKTKIKLGDKSKYTYLNIDMGAAKLEIDIPATSGCKLTGDMVLMSKDLQGFNKKNSGYYVTDNFEDAESKVFVDIDGGVSSIKINRY